MHQIQFHIKTEDAYLLNGILFINIERNYDIDIRDIDYIHKCLIKLLELPGEELGLAMQLTKRSIV